jgi:hypothetical protein
MNSEKQEIIIATDEEIDQAVSDFTLSYFKDIREYIQTNYRWFESNNIKKLNSVEYFKIRRFLYTAINNLLELDKEIRVGVLDTLMSDVDNMYKYYEQITADTKRNAIVMERDFLKTFDNYVKIKKLLNDNQKKKQLYESQDKKSKSIIDELDKIESMNEEQIAKYKAAKRQNADAVHLSQEAREIVSVVYEQEKVLKTKITTLFDDKFEVAKKEVIGSLIDVINVTSFCLDQALWYYAENSKSIKRFFNISQIKGDFSLRTYIDYYLKSVGESSNSVEVKELKQAMKDLDQR